VTLESCPTCGGKLTEKRVDFAYITDLPALPQPKLTQYRVWVCQCTGCGRRVRGQHPDLAPDQYGVTAHRVGKRGMAAAHTLHYQMGVPVRKGPGVLETLAGLKLTQGAITQDALRWARGQVGAAYQQLRRSVRESPAVYTDDTSWRVGGENAHLMAFDTDEVTVYQVRPRHRHQEVQEVVPANYRGVMVTDRGRSYEAHSFSRVKQQKGLAHLQKTLSLLLEKKKGRARELGENLKMLFEMALDLWEEYHTGAVTDFETRVAELRFCRQLSATGTGPRQPALAEGAAALPPAGRAATLSGGASGRAHQQPDGASPAAGGDCPEGLSMLQKRGWSLCFLCLQERDSDPAETGCWGSSLVEVLCALFRSPEAQLAPS
jgi:transposase